MYKEVKEYRVNKSSKGVYGVDMYAAQYGRPSYYDQLVDIYKDAKEDGFTHCSEYFYMGGIAQVKCNDVGDGAPLESLLDKVKEQHRKVVSELESLNKVLDKMPGPSTAST